MSTLKIAIVAQLSMVALAGCGREAAEPPPAAPPPPAAEEAVSFSYQGPTGPANWGFLRDAYRVCATGSEQSPIDVATAEAASEDLPPLGFDYRPVAARVNREPFTFKVELPPGESILTIGEEAFTLLQFHVHTPSEHRLDGASAPMELHLVHQNDQETLAVVGVMLELGAANDTLAAVLEALDRGAATTTLDPAGVLPADTGSYRYPGSLTTPDCDEGVRWHLLATPITLSQDQLDAYLASFPDGTNRPLQPLGTRTVVTDVGD